MVFNMATQVKQMLAKVFRMKSGANSGAQEGGAAKPKINVTVNGKPLGLAQAATETETEKHHYDSSGDSSEGADSDY